MVIAPWPLRCVIGGTSHAPLWLRLGFLRLIIRPSFDLCSQSPCVIQMWGGPLLWEIEDHSSVKRVGSTQKGVIINLFMHVFVKQINSSVILRCIKALITNGSIASPALRVFLQRRHGWRRRRYYGDTFMRNITSRSASKWCAAVQKTLISWYFWNATSKNAKYHLRKAASANWVFHAWQSYISECISWHPASSLHFETTDNIRTQIRPQMRYTRII